MPESHNTINWLRCIEVFTHFFFAKTKTQKGNSNMNIFTRSLFAGIALFTVCAAGAAEQKPSTLYYDKNNGSVGIAGAFNDPRWQAAFKVSHYDGKYKPMKQFVFDGIEQEGRLVTANDERIPVKIQCIKKSPTEYQAKVTAESEQPFSSSRLMYEQFIRYKSGVGVTVKVNDELFDFSKPFDPKKPYQKILPALADGKETVVVVDAPNASWTITGRFAVILQDQRKWNSDSLQLRLMFTPYSGMIANASLDFNLVLNPKSK